jgi:hypothetical protein
MFGRPSRAVVRKATELFLAQSTVGGAYHLLTGTIARKHRSWCNFSTDY